MTGTPSGVEVWLVDVAGAGSALAALEKHTPRLSDDERARAAKLARPDENWRLFRIALRVLLERVLGPKMRGVPYQIGPRGKPSLPRPAGVEFSLSHSGQHGLIAIADDLVGVDLEQERRVSFPPEREQAMLAAALALAPVPSADSRASRPFGILQAWVRLEAWGKARGSGIGALLHDLDIRGPAWTNRGDAPDFGELAADLLRRERLAVRDLALPPGLHGAVVARNETIAPAVRNFPTDPAGLEALLNGK